MATAAEGVPKVAGHRYPGARNPEFRRVLITGAMGKVGVKCVQVRRVLTVLVHAANWVPPRPVPTPLTPSPCIQAFHKDASGKPWEVVATDVARGVFDTPGATDPWNYQQADLTDAGEVFSMVARFQPDAVVHIAAIPDIEHNAPHTVFANNITATFNVVEACVMFGVPRLVNISSEQAPGFFSNNGPPGGAVCHPKYCPVDEEHPMTPNNSYSLSKSFGEQTCDAAVRRTAGSTDLAVISIRPSWCQDERNIERNLGPLIRDHSIEQEGLWSYIDIYDLSDSIVLASAAGALPDLQSNRYPELSRALPRRSTGWLTTRFQMLIGLASARLPASDLCLLLNMFSNLCLPAGFVAQSAPVTRCYTLPPQITSEAATWPQRSRPRCETPALQCLTRLDSSGPFWE